MNLMNSTLRTLAALTVMGAWLTSAENAPHSAIDPKPRPDAGWQNRHKAMNEKVAEQGSKAQVIFIGDSITQGWEGAGKEVWARYYAHRNAINLGIGGDRTQHVLWRLDNGNLKGINPKAAVVMIGTNNSNGEDNTPGQIVDGITAIVQKLRQELPETKILLVAIFPRNENFSPQRGKILQVNQVLRKLADDQSVFWIDFGHEFVDNQGLIPFALMPDYLHLSVQGYEIWAKAMESRLATILGDSPVGAASRVEGAWLLTIPGPNETIIEMALELKQNGDQVTGRIARGSDRWLPIENGHLKENEISWTVKRDRPDGGVMTYQMSGKVDQDQMRGTTRTELDGRETSNEWTAKRIKVSEK